MSRYQGKSSSHKKILEAIFSKKRKKIAVVALCVALTLTFTVTAGRPAPRSVDTLSRTAVNAKNPFYNINSSVEQLTNKIIIRATKAEKLKLNKTSLTIGSLSDTVQLTATIAPKNTTNKSVTYTSENEAVATVSENGLVTPVADGVTQIICTTMDGTNLTADCTVVVATDINSQKIDLNKTEIKFTKETESEQLTAVFTPSDILDQAVIWQSSDTDVATVDENGNVKPVANGTAVVTCTSASNQSVVAYCDVTVEMPVKATDILLNYGTISYVGLGCMEQLQPTFTPATVTNKKVKYSSSDEAIARVNEDGIVSPVANGSCTITCTTTDGTKLTDTCEVTVSGVVDYIPVTSLQVVIPQNIDVTATEPTVIAEAQKYVGWLPYVWGGTSLTGGVDCSGFICAVYGKFGYNLWGMRTDLDMAGTEVASIADAKAGDILVYSGHVAIYDGNGGKIHAPDEGYMVSHDYSIGNYKCIRRIIQD